MPPPARSQAGTDTERARNLHAFEVFGQVAEDVLVVAAGREDVDEAEELDLELRVRERPVEDALAPAPEVEELCPLRRAGLADAAGDRLHLPLARVGHSQESSRRATSYRARWAGSRCANSAPGVPR